jgi:hypothetical protein
MEIFNNKNYILVNTDQDVKILAKSLNFDNYQIITTGPYASHELDKRNLSYKSIDSFHDRDAFGIQINKESQSKFYQITSHIDKHLAEKKFNEKTLEYFEYHVLFLLDTILGRILILKAFYEQAKPEKIIYAQRTSSPPSDFLLSDNDSWSQFINLYSKAYGIQSTIFSDDDGSNFKKLLKKCFNRKSLTKIPFEHSWLKTKIINLATTIKALGVKNGLINQFRQKKLLMLGALYEWSKALKHLFSLGEGIAFQKVTYLSKKRYYKHLKIWLDIKNSLLLDQTFLSLFVFEKINILPTLGPYIDRMIASSLAFESSFNNKANYKGVLFSYITNGAIWKNVKQLRQTGAKTFAWPHGAAGIWYNIKSEAPQLNIETDYLLTYGEGTKNRMDAFAENFEFSSIPIGSSNLDRLLIYSKNEKKENIVYVTTNYFGSTIMYYWTPVWSDLHQYEWQRKILSYLDTLHDEKIIFKHHPSQKTYANLPKINFRNPNLHVISDTSSFTNLLPSAKIIILDNLSTTLMQALTTTVPLFILLTNRETSKDSLAALKKRAICSESVDVLINSIDQYINSDFYPADSTNEEALHLYGTFLGDGKSHIRAAEFVKKKLS